jgi:UMF1 family MFS transporter
VTWVTANDHKSAMLATGVFFVLGLVLLRGVDPERGRRAALAAE